MRTAVDSSVLWCLLNREAGAAAWDACLQRAAEEGELVICPVVFSEVAPAYRQFADAWEDLLRLCLRYDPIAPEAAWLAGQIFKSYRLAGGAREHMVPDFLIAAHAKKQAGRLAAIDRGYFRRYFADLPLLGPGGATVAP